MNYLFMIDALIPLVRFTMIGYIYELGNFVQLNLLAAM